MSTKKKITKKTTTKKKPALSWAAEHVRALTGYDGVAKRTISVSTPCGDDIKFTLVAPRAIAEGEVGKAPWKFKEAIEFMLKESYKLGYKAAKQDIRAMLGAASEADVEEQSKRISDLENYDDYF